MHFFNQKKKIHNLFHLLFLNCFFMFTFVDTREYITTLMYVVNIPHVTFEVLNKT